ncbi:MAG: recombinase family protein [Actinomycetia bacterium]|nr:recombinase family protein [Actinomycetes bacterium]
MQVITVDRDHPQPTRVELDAWADSIQGIIYARVSTADQAKHGYSLESQVERCAAWAKQQYRIHDDELLAIVERGEMGDDPNRPALNFALRLIEEGVGRRFIVLHPDRFSRDLGLQLQVASRILGAGCEMGFVEVDFDPTNPESTLMFNIQGAIAQYNKAKILANSKRGRRTKARNGKIPGTHRIYGYAFDKERDILVENPEEKAVYLQIVHWLLNGLDGKPMTATAIAQELSRRGIPAPEGPRWHQATVARMLRNPAYLGTYYYGKTETVQRNGKKQLVKKPREEWIAIKIPAYIDEITFQRIQQRLDDLVTRNTTRGRKPKGQYLLRGLVRCGLCGGAAGAAPSSRDPKTKQVRHYYYRCINASAKSYEVGTGEPTKKCRGRYWRTEVADKLVWDEIKRIVLDPDSAIQKILGMKITDKDMAEMTTRVHAIQESLAAKEMAKNRVMDLYIAGMIPTKEELAKRLAPIEKDIAYLRESLTVQEGLMAQAGNDNALWDSLHHKLIGFQKWFDRDVTFAQKEEVVRAIVKQVLLYQDHLEVIMAWDVPNRTPPDPDGSTRIENTSEGDGGPQERIPPHPGRLPAGDGELPGRQPRSLFALPHSLGLPGLLAAGAHAHHRTDGATTGVPAHRGGAPGADTLLGAPAGVLARERGERAAGPQPGRAGRPAAGGAALASGRTHQPG